MKSNADTSRSFKGERVGTEKKLSKNILITGVSTGIGYDLCKTFLSAGYRVFGSVRKPKDAFRLRKNFGSQFKALVFDVTDHQAIDDAAMELRNEIGDEGLCGLINNAGIAIAGPIQYVDIEAWRQQFEVNVIGMIKVTQAFLPLLGAMKNCPFKPGKIIQMSSNSGGIGMPFLGPYAGSKFAMEGISTSLRGELLIHGIDVIVIGPGPILTSIWEKGSDRAKDKVFDKTEYKDALSVFQNKLIKKALEKGWRSEKLAKKVLKVFRSVRPKARYAMLSNSFLRWTLPRLLPYRLLDRFFGKQLGFI